MKVATVRDISDQVRGVTYAKSEASAVPRSGYSPMLRANNIGEHGLLLDNLIFVPNAKISRKQRIVPNDVIVAASSGSISVVGKTAQARLGFDGGFGAFCKVLRPGPDVDPHYFGHYFKTPSYRRVVSQLASGANINNLKKEHLDNLLIPLPPLAEQQRIAGILDAADALRTKRRETLAQLDVLLQSTFPRHVRRPRQVRLDDGNPSKLWPVSRAVQSGRARSEANCYTANLSTKGFEFSG